MNCILKTLLDGSLPRFPPSQRHIEGLGGVQFIKAIGEDTENACGSRFMLDPVISDEGSS
jgi:hypothetical protein